MQADRHQEIRNMIDRSLVGAAPLQEEQALREHLVTCTACQEYLNVSHRAIGALGGFSFEVNPHLHEKVNAALALRAQQLEANRIKKRPMLWSYIAAFVLTVIGSLAAVQFSGLAVAIFHIEPAPWHFGLLALWVVPSLCLCLLFPFLHRLSSGWMNEKGLSQ